MQEINKIKALKPGESCVYGCAPTGWMGHDLRMAMEPLYVSGEYDFTQLAQTGGVFEYRARRRMVQDHKRREYWSHLMIDYKTRCKAGG